MNNPKTPLVGLVGWRGMVGSVLMERMLAECVEVTITECIDDDGCCPEGCSHCEDNDCHW